MVDKYTDLPPSLRKKVKQADEFIIAAGKAKEQGTPPPILHVEPPVESPSVAPPEPPIEELPIEEPPVEPIVEPISVEPPVIPSTVSKDEYDKLVQEHATLKGKYDKEPAELQRTVNFLTEQVLKLTEVQATPPVKSEVPEKPIREVLMDMPEFRTLKENMVPEAFEALLGSQERVYTLALDRARKEANQTITQEVGRVDAKFAQTAEQRFWADFNRDYSDWATIKSSPEFQTFVNNEDPLTGISRYAIIKDAFDRRDLNGVVRFLDVATGRKRIAPVVPSVTDPATIQSKLAGKVVPNRSNGPPVSTTPPAKMTVAEATKELVSMANLKNRGLWKGTQDEYIKRDATLRKLISTGSRAAP